ncbi:aldo/keto reductase [Streptomyces sp. M19]
MGAARRPVGGGRGHHPARRRRRPVSDLQIEYSLISRGVEDAILPVCRELGIGITAYGVLARGLISGHWTRDRQLSPATSAASAPVQRREPGPQPGPGGRAARDRRGPGVSVAQVAIAWVLAQATRQDAAIVPLIGARRRDRLTEALGALDVTLTDADLAAIEKAVPPGAAAGARYPEQQMVHLDSEK